MENQSDVLQAENTFFTGLVEARVNELDKLLADDFTLADLRGNLVPKAALLEVVGSRQLRFDAIKPLEAAVRFYGSTAVVTGRTEMSGRFNQEAFRAHSRYTHIYFEREGRLCLVAAQGTPIAAG
ncbi:MAG: nuclear transport factor 2 family protein [Deltaproteobacteria bacterium]